MLFRLFLLFTIIPAIEVGLLVMASTRIGVLNTLLIILLTAIAGSLMVRHEGLSVMRRFRESMAAGVFPSEEIFDGAMVLVAGALLLTPGFFTDVLGLMMVFPLTREILKAYIRKYIEKRILIVTSGRPGPWR